MLQLSSCLFGTVTLHAYWARSANIHFLTLGQTILSLLNYGGMHEVRHLDMAFAIGFFGQGVLQLAYERSWLLAFALAVPVLYGIERRYEGEHTKTLLHVALHIVACVGLHIYLYQG
jgi:hypothetical protein